MTRESPLDNAQYAAFAWRRYWRLMRMMLVFTLFVTAAVLTSFWWFNGMVSIHFFIATGGAIIASIMLMAGLMGLVFLSSGTGHDESIEDPFPEQDDDQ